jgi:sugar phosphate isomerase/epimerase
MHSNTPHPAPTLVETSRRDVLPAASSRRDFLRKTTLAAAGTFFCSAAPGASAAANPWTLPVVVFSKVFQTLHLDFASAAAVTAEAGLDGVDAPVRAGGEILPENAAQELPRYVEALRARKLTMPFITTGITSPSSPHAEAILRTAKRLGVSHYRLGFFNPQSGIPVRTQIGQIRGQLKKLVPLNKELGLGAVFENHSGTATIGGDLDDLKAIVDGFDPAQIGIAFDIGHALVAHGKDWRRRFEALKSHLKVAYVKDVTWDGRWVPFGQGALGELGYFHLLKEMGYHLPIELHIEFDWSAGGTSQNRAALVTALKDSALVLRRWLAQA